MTTSQVLSRQKTVTRRLGWQFLKAGDVVTAVKQSQGLRRGQKVERFCDLRIIDVRREPLHAITQADCAKEGFPDYSPCDFIQMMCEHYGVNQDVIVTRIEFEYLPS